MDAKLEHCRIQNWYPRLSVYSLPTNFVFLMDIEIQALQSGDTDSGIAKSVIDRLASAMNKFPFTRFVGTDLVVDEKNDDGTYFLQNVSDDGMLTVYQQGGINLPDADTPEEEYALNLATGLSETGANDDARIKPSNEYSDKMTYPVYVASFTSGSNEDTRQWWVYITFSDSGVYLYGINTPVDAETDAGALADEVFPGLWMKG